MTLQRKAPACAVLTILLCVAASADTKKREAPRGVQVVAENFFPELHVDGEPFFLHAASFPYFKLPADLWARSLGEYRALGINTISLHIPMNWHETRSGEFDFEGRTNPRRNLRRLLRLVAEHELKLMVWWPPDAIDGWRNSGVPDWAAHSEREGWAVAEAAFRREILKELQPYAPRTALKIPDPEARKLGQEKEISGPWIAIQATEVAPPGFPQDLGIAVFSSGAPAPGEWRAPRTTLPRPGEGMRPASRITPEEVARLEWTAAAAKMRSNGPAFVGRVELAPPLAADDVRPVDSDPSDPLLVSRLLLAQGVGGINYEAIQDALAPAGFAGPDTNRFARINVALDVNAARHPGARNLARNGLFVEAWSEFLATAHKRADLAIAAPSAKNAARTLQLARVAALADLSVDWVDPSAQALERLLQNPVLIFNTEDDSPETVQAQAMEYARRGGTLVVYPKRPGGKDWEAVWAQPEIQPGVRTFSAGHVIDLEVDPFAWVKLADSFEATRANAGYAAAAQEFNRWMTLARTQPIARRPNSNGAPLVLTQLVSNRGTGVFGERDPQSTTGLMSVTNLGSDTAEEQLEILTPRSGPRTPGAVKTGITVSVPPHESMFLPVHLPLCTLAGKKPCDDEITIAGAEFLLAQREGKTLELTFYAPVRSVVRLRLAQQPSRVRTEERSIDGLWTPATRQFELAIPRAPAPDYLRVVKIQLPYEPQVPEKPNLEKIGRRDYEFAVSDAIRMPLAQDAALETYPPLIILKGDRTGRMVMSGKNYDEMGRGIDFRVAGPIKGDRGMGLSAGELGFERLDLKPAEGNKAEPGFLEGQVHAKSGRDQRSLPVAFVAVSEKGVVPYQFDFDRDGAPEWTLEDDHLRVIASPENGGRIVALVDKESGLSLTNSLGLLQDLEYLQTATPEPPQSGANQPYAAEWIAAGENTALRLTSPTTQGMKIEKTLRIPEKQVLEVKYRWSGALLDQRTLAVSGSVPVTLHGDGTTRFCWEKPRDKGQAESEGARSDSPEMQCEIFSPSGRPVQVPEGIHHVEVRTPGSFALRMEWEKGRMWVLMKNYSAELRLEFSRAETGAGAGENVIRHRAVVVE